MEQYEAVLSIFLFYIYIFYFYCVGVQYDFTKMFNNVIRAVEDKMEIISHTIKKNKAKF
jgi:hypothetical protein